MAVKQFKKINKDFNEPRAVRRSLVHQLWIINRYPMNTVQSTTEM